MHLCGLCTTRRHCAYSCTGSLQRVPRRKRDDSGCSVAANNNTPSGSAGRGCYLDAAQLTDRTYGVTESVDDTARVPVAVRVAVRVRVGIDVRVCEGVRVSDAVLVFDGVFVTVLVGDTVRVFVDVRVRDGVTVLDAVRVAVAVFDAVAVVVSKDDTAVAVTANGSERFVAGRASPIQHDPQLVNLPCPSWPRPAHPQHLIV